MRGQDPAPQTVSSSCEAVFETPLFLVVSAMGYGKTTAVRDF